MATRQDVPAAVAGAAAGTGSYLEWGAVFGGAAIAVAIYLVLFQFGAAVGLALGEPVLPGGGTSWNVVAAGLWVAWLALVSAAAGGYIAGRMRARWGDASEHEVEIRDGTHGLVVWAVSTMTAVLLAAAIAALTTAEAARGAARPEDVARIAGNISVIFAFATAAGAALGAAAAWWAATVGGAHRDRGTALQAPFMPAFFRKRG